MSIFKKAYELVENAPEGLDWDTYERLEIEKYEELLKQKGSKESIFQEFFERNPAFLPGAFGIYGESGHLPYNNALITQPNLQGLTSKIPDFLWIASDSGTIYPTFIEIETPNKRWFRKDGVQTAEFTQAQSQLNDWKTWLLSPVHQKLFYEYYDIDKEIIKGKAVKPKFILIIGSRNEFDGNPALIQKRAQLERANETYMTFDRLAPNSKARNTITCKVVNRQYNARFISPTFRLGPVNAEELNKIDNIEKAVEDSEICDQRKKFILSRLTYWKDFSREQPNALRNTGDWE